MSDPVDHHYIPQFYFKPWCDRVDGRMTCYRRVHDGSISEGPVAPKSTAYEPHLNSLTDVPPENRADLERHLASQVDDPAAKVIAKLLGGDGNLTDIQFCDMVRFVLGLRYRTPEVIQHLKKAVPGKFRHEVEKSQSEYAASRMEGHPATILEFMDKYKGQAFQKNIGLTHIVPRLINNSERGQQLTELDWWILKPTSSKHRFLTSDRPLIMDRMLDKKDEFIVLPVSPYHVLLGARLKKMVEQDIARIGQTEFVKWVNDRVVGQAKERCYSISIGQKAFVDKRLGRDHGLHPYSDKLNLELTE